MEETALIWRWLPAFPLREGLHRELLRSLAMTSLGTCRFRRDAGTNLRAPPLPCHCEEGASPTRQSQVGTFDFAGAFPCSGRYCEIAAPCSARLAMTNLGAFPHSEGRSAELASAALPCHSEERSDVGISCRHLRFRRSPAVPALTAVYRITKPGHVLRRVPVLSLTAARTSLYRRGRGRYSPCCRPP